MSLPDEGFYFLSENLAPFQFSNIEGRLCAFNNGMDNQSLVNKIVFCSISLLFIMLPEPLYGEKSGTLNKNEVIFLYE